MGIRTPAPATTITAVLACLLATVGGALTSSPAAAVDCTGGTTTTWTGLGDGHGWADAANWDAGAPTDTGSAVVGSAVLAVDGITGTVCGLTVSGPASVPGPALTGALTVVGDAAVSGASSWSGTLMSTQSLTVAASADLALGDGAVVTIASAGTLGAGALVHGPASPPAVAPVIATPGTLTLGGAATMDGVALALQPRDGGAGILELAGSTLTLTGTAVSTMSAGTALTSSAAGGALVAASGAQLVVTTGATVQQPASLRLTTGSTLGQDGGAATISGTGGLNWQAGSVAGDITLSLPALLDGGGTRLVPDGSTLTNNNELTVADGVLDLRGTLVNNQGLTLRPGSTVRGTDTNPSLLSNVVGATVAVEPTSSGGNAVLDGAHLSNAGTLSVPVKSRLVLGSTGTQTTSDLLDGGILSAPGLPSDSSDKGTLQVTRGATLRLSGQTRLDKAVLLLDDPTGTGSTARVQAGSATATLTATNQGDGFFSWRSGILVGALTIDKLSLDITSTSGTAHRVLEGLDDAHPGLLSLGGTAVLNPATVELAAKAKLVVTGTLTLASAPGGIDPVGALDGQQLLVATGGQLRHIAQSTTPTGSSSSTSPMTISVPVLNNGTVTLETSLNVPAGYTQDVGAGAPPTADAPVTGLFGTAVLSSSNGTSAGPITLVQGGLGGTGTVEANPLTTGTGFLHPGTSSATGTMTLKGPVQLGSGTDLQIVLKGPTEHDRLVVQPLTVGANTYPGTLALSGQISGLSSEAYDPPYGTSVPDVVTFASRTGTFSSGFSSGTSNGLGWRPTYPKPTSVALSIADVAPPAIGIAANPAFTQLGSQRFTYAAVDNRSGVKSYDVRYRFGNPSTGWSGLAYPGPWQGTTATSVSHDRLQEGITYCFSVRARDNALNTTAWSQELCTARMYDDRAASASAGWTRPGGQPGWNDGTYSRTTTLGATLKRAGTFRRVALTGQRCPTCGAVVIYSNGTLIGKLNLAGSATGLTSWVSPVLKSRTAMVTIKVITSGRPVAIDAIGIAR